MRKYDKHGAYVFMAQIDGYVMTRRPGCVPVIKSKKAWDLMSDKPVPVAAKPQPDQPAQEVDK